MIYSPRLATRWTVRSRLLTLAVTAVVVGGGSTLAAAPAPKKAKPARSTRATWERKTAKLARQTARLRRLRLRRKIRIVLLDERGAKAALEKRLTRDYKPAELAAEQAVFTQLGMLPKGLDYRKTVLALLGEQVAGFYDPKTRRLEVAAWLPFERQRGALVHQICHALQDQNLRLTRFTRSFKRNSDRRLARLALVEGDCSGVMIEHALRRRGIGLGSASALVEDLLARGPARDSKRLREAPLFLRRSLRFPYVAGLRLVQRLRRRSSWRTITRLYRRPPETTEQVLHPRKLWRRERAVRVRARDLPALAGWRRIKVDTFGELLLSVYLEQTLERRAAERAAAGWGGDRLAAYLPAATLELGATPDSAPLIVHLSTWDSEADAIEFENAHARVLTARFGKSQRAGLQRLFPMPGGKETVLQRRRRTVLLVLGAKAALRVAVQAQVWKRWRVAGRRP